MIYLVCYILGFFSCAGLVWLALNIKGFEQIFDKHDRLGQNVEKGQVFFAEPVSFNEKFDKAETVDDVLQ